QRKGILTNRKLHAAGFFSVFSITEKPVVMSGGESMMATGFQILLRTLLLRKGQNDLFERSIPKPFDLTRYLSAAVTFLANVKQVTVLFNGSPLSIVRKTSQTSRKIDFPTHLKPSHASMTVKAVEMIPQKVEVTVNALAYAGSSHSYGLDRKGRPSTIDMVAGDSFFEETSEQDTIPVVPQTRPLSERVFCAQYTVYSANVVCNPSNKMKRGIHTATMKDPPEEFLVQAVHLSRKEYESASRGIDDGFGSVFVGPKGLVSDQEHGARLFIGQSTDQTTGIAVHLSSRFIPTVERGLIDLTNGEVQRWNEENLRVSGFLIRLIYEEAMNNVRKLWSPATDQAREEASFIMDAFTFRSSTPHAIVGDILRNAFLECSTDGSLPIVSNHGILESKDVRPLDPQFASFMTNQPVVDETLAAVTSAMMADFPKQYKLSGYHWRDVERELKERTLTQDEMNGFVAWLVEKFKESTTEEEPRMKGRESTKNAIVHAAKVEITPGRVVKLHRIKKFVDFEVWETYIRDGMPLPPDTVPLRLVGRKADTSADPDAMEVSLDPDALQKVLGWQKMNIADWIDHLTNAKNLDPDHNIRLSATFAQRVFAILHSLWPSAGPEKLQIVEQLRDIQCIATTLGRKKPEEAYFPEADLFGDLPVIEISNLNRQMLQELGVKGCIEWNSVKKRLPHPSCTPRKLAAYIRAAYTNMDNDEHEELRTMAIFECEGGKRHCIKDLHVPDVAGLHRKLGLPVVCWRDASSAVSQEALSPLIQLGLREHPDLNVVIESACSQDTEIQEDAFNFLISNIEKLYTSYNPENFQKAAFIPCGNLPDARLGSPWKVVLSPEWEPLGFERPHHSLDAKTQTLLKIRDHPSPSAIVDALQINKPKTRDEAQSWFELLGKHLPTMQAKTLSNLQIVPVGTGENLVTPRECILEEPGHSNHQYCRLFHFVQFSDTAADFLEMCGAKREPTCGDIAEALVRNAEDHRTFVKDEGYLDTLRRVAADYQTLADDLKKRMINSAIFLGHRRKRGKIIWRLLRAAQIVIIDDVETHRLFQDDVFVAPKEERLESFYKEMGAKTLSTHATHTADPKEPSTIDGKDLGVTILQRVAIFLHINDGFPGRLHEESRKELSKPEKFAVRYCRDLYISTSLDIPPKHEGDPRKVRKSRAARAGMAKTEEGDHILWVTNDESKPEQALPMRDISVALCSVLFKEVKRNDQLLLTAILSAAQDHIHDLCDVDQVLKNFMETNPEPQQVNTKDMIMVFKTSNSTDPPREELEEFSSILMKLGKVFGLEAAQIRICWQSDNEDLMGFNNGGALYFSLAYFSKEHYRTFHDDKVAVYSAWFFIMAHEIAHSEATFHDEDHERWLVTIAQCKLTAFWRMLDQECLTCSMK
ncbi:hypothetical protein ID866_5207, partial [Astraeus odoratus]